MRYHGLKGGHAATKRSKSQQQQHQQVEEQNNNSSSSSNHHYNQWTICTEDSSLDLHDYDYANGSSNNNNNTNTGIPKGMQNVGNTCYANATLQCLLNTALSHALTDPVASAIFRRYSSNPNILAKGSGSVDSEDDCTTTGGTTISTTGTTTSTHSNTSQQQRKLGNKQWMRERKRLEDLAMHENCQWLTSELRQITREYQATHNSNSDPLVSSSSSNWLYGPSLLSPSRRTVPEVINPGPVTRNPNRLSSGLTPYQQEDAHEFLRALLGTLVMQGQNKELSSLFDGLLESAVTCQSCFRPSLTRDRYMDLSLDIADANIHSLKDALNEFTTTETLSGENAVYCRYCECKQTATKGLRLATAPSILVCHFKRFACDAYGRMVRLKKKITIPLRLEIGDFMSKVNQARPPPYELVAVLVHQGNSCESGHYLAYVKNAGSWYRCNDAIVEPVDVETVLSQQAYIVFYEVAEMRENHGFSLKTQRYVSVDSSNKSKQQQHSMGGSTRSSSARKQSPRDDFFAHASSMLLCGMDYDASVFSDLCHFNWGRPSRRVPRRSPRSRSGGGESGSHHSHDELSTLGESTVESSDTQRRGRFRRSSSSGNLRGDHARSSNAVRSMSVSTRHRRQHSSNGFESEKQQQQQHTASGGSTSTTNGHHAKASSWKGAINTANGKESIGLRPRRATDLPPRPSVSLHRRVLSSDDAPPNKLSND